ncbi:MAG: hypothetical protein MUO50_00645, partial [Longimicrobiales bacterium]|nr:hypothetical protein [Longimicrobiales bacterium]
MTARARRVFAPVLREVEYDLEELWGRLVADGLPEEEAHRQALDALVPDSGTLGELDRLHTPLYKRWTRDLTPGHLRLAERSALVLATTSVLLAQAVTLVNADL